MTSRQAKQRQTSLRNMHFNRYLLVRYFTAGYFFMNLYWLILLASMRKMTLILPACLLVGLVLVCAEQVKQYRQPSRHLPQAYCYYWLQLSINICLLISLYTPLFTNLYPFIKPTGKGALAILLVVGSIGCIVVERKLFKIAHDQDRYFKALKDFEASIQ